MMGDMPSLPKGIGDSTVSSSLRIGVTLGDMPSLPKGIGDDISSIQLTPIADDGRHALTAERHW